MNTDAKVVCMIHELSPVACHILLPELPNTPNVEVLRREVLARYEAGKVSAFDIVCEWDNDADAS